MWHVGPYDPVGIGEAEIPPCAGQPARRRTFGRSGLPQARGRLTLRSDARLAQAEMPVRLGGRHQSNGLIREAEFTQRRALPIRDH